VRLSLFLGQICISFFISTRKCVYYTANLFRFHQREFGGYIVLQIRQLSVYCKNRPTFFLQMNNNWEQMFKQSAFFCLKIFLKYLISWPAKSHAAPAVQHLDVDIEYLFSHISIYSYFIPWIIKYFFAGFPWQEFPSIPTLFANRKQNIASQSKQKIILRLKI
jgi:hypothetical protein